MVSLPDVIASNERGASTLPSGLVAIFVGGTSGVGEYTVKALAKYTSIPRVYIVGRSQEAADRILEKCRQLNPGGIFEFIKADVGLLRNVDHVCRYIKTKETTINILFQSQGSMAFGAVTSEGLPLASALAIHSRTRFIFNFIPLIQRATSIRRVVSVLAATTEGAIDTSNVSAQSFPIIKWRNQMASVQTLLLEEAAQQAPNISFVHCLPGIVKSGIMRDAEGFKNAIFIAIGKILTPFIQTPPEECGQRHMFLATSARYPPRQGGTTTAGVPLDQNLEVARGSDGRIGSGVYTIGPRGDSSSPEVENLLSEFRKNGTASQVWESVIAEFEKITGT